MLFSGLRTNPPSPRFREASLRCLHRLVGEHTLGRGPRQEWGEKAALGGFTSRGSALRLHHDEDRQRAIRRVLQSRVLERERLQDQCTKTEDAVKRLKWVRDRMQARDRAAQEALQPWQDNGEVKKLPWHGNPMERFGFYVQYEDTEKLGGIPWFEWSPLLVLGLISAGYCLLFLKWSSATTPEQLAEILDTYSASVHGIFVEHRYETLITNAFLHLSEASLAGNLFGLWLFGWKLHQVLGFPRFAMFYTASAVTTTLLQLAADVIRRAPYLSSQARVDLLIRSITIEDANERAPLVSQLRTSSTAVLGGKSVGMAISAGTIFLFPWDRIRMLRILPMMAMPLPIGVALFCASEMFGITEHGAVFNLVGTGADASGFVCGWLLTLLFWRLHPQFRERTVPFFNFIRGRPSPRTKHADEVDLFRSFYHNKRGQM